MSYNSYIPAINTSSEYYGNYERSGRFGQFTINGYPRVEQGSTPGTESSGSIARIKNNLESSHFGERTTTLEGGQTSKAGRILCYDA